MEVTKINVFSQNLGLEILTTLPLVPVYEQVSFLASSIKEPKFRENLDGDEEQLRNAKNMGYCHFRKQY